MAESKEADDAEADESKDKKVAAKAKRDDDTKDEDDDDDEPVAKRDDEAPKVKVLKESKAVKDAKDAKAKEGEQRAAAKEKAIDPAERAAREKAKKQKWMLFAIVALLSLAADQATKIWARASLPVEHVHHQPYQCEVPEDIVTRTCQGKAVSVVSDYWDWRLSMNPGSAFGLFGNNQSLARVMLSIVGILAVAGMLWMLRKARSDQKILHWALALVAGGAVGNLIDRVYYGVVTDFILWRYKTHEWPVFNVADIVLVVGVGLMFIDIQKESKREKAKKRRRAERAKAAGLVKDL